MGIQVLGPASSARIQKCAEAVFDLMLSKKFDDPNRAIAKVAAEVRDEQGRLIPREHLHHLVYAYNAGESVRRMSDPTAGHIDKVASFPLADTGIVDGMVWGRPIAEKAASAPEDPVDPFWGTAVPAGSNRPAGMTKLASLGPVPEQCVSKLWDPAPPPDRSAAERAKATDELGKAAMACWREYSAACRKARSRLSDLPAFNIEKTAAAIATARPDLSAAFGDIVAMPGPRLVAGKHAAILDFDSGPMAKIAEAGQWLAIAVDAFDSYEGAKEEQQKEAGFISDTIKGVGTVGIGGSVRDRLLPHETGMSEDERASKVDRIIRQDVNDPDLSQKLREIAAREALASIVKSQQMRGHSLPEIADSFNRLSAIAPRLMGNEVASGSLIGRDLHSGAQYDSHDIKELVTTDRQLQPGGGRVQI